LKSFVAESGVDPEEDVVSGVESEAEADVRLNVIEIPLIPIVEDLAGVGE
jgi:hypothetical protein